MKILIAPDKFKEACTAKDAANALARGVRQVLPAADITLCPLADGGDGTGTILAEAITAKPREVTVCDPRGIEIKATWWWHERDKLAIIEMAEASGLRLVPSVDRNPLHLTSYGTGQLLQEAIDAGAEQIWLGCGGSATVDGGVAMMQALGYEMRDREGSCLPVPLAPTDFHRIHQLVEPAEPISTEITILSDVTNPILGRQGAANTFGPQKGADHNAVNILEDALTHWVQRLAQHVGAGVENRPSSGAAGGIPAPLMALLGATSRLGLHQVFESTKISSALQACDLCLTGEGRLDAQSQLGKVVGELAKLSTKPVVAFVGSVESSVSEFGLRDVVVITPPNATLPEALAKTTNNLCQAASNYFAKIQA